MVLDSSLLCQSKLESVARAESQSSERSGSKRIEWSGRVLTGASDCDAKTLAARRKRSEIRRLRLMAAAIEADDEPIQKRMKASLSCKGELKALHSIAKPAIRSGTLISGGHNHEMHETQATTGAASCMVRPVSGQGVRTVDDGDGGDSTVEIRLSDLDSSAACPSHCVVSICGRSREMEDAAIAVPSFLAMPSSVLGQRHTETFHYYGVYDGHGGPQAAEFCKERMHGVLADEMSASGDILLEQWEECFRSSFGRLDAELCGFCPHGSECPLKSDASSASTSSSCREPLVPGSVGTTALVAVVGAEHIVVGNCGDSRAVLSRGGQVVPLSVDHKANRPDEVARIEAAGGHVFTWEGHRVCGVLAMSRALGDGFLKPFVSGQPEVTVTARSDDDECLILASDGLWDVLSNEFVCAVARKALANWRSQHTDLKRHRTAEGFSPSQVDVDAGDSPAQVVAALLTKLALAKHSKDNISVIVVDLKRL